MNIDILTQSRNFLLRTFAVSVILAWVLAAFTIGLWDFWSGIMSQWFHTPVADFGPLISNWFALIKFYVLFVLLAPAIGLHWEIKRRVKTVAS